MSTSTFHPRRFLRFRLRTLLLLPLLFAFTWWWVTWPERTARRFVELLASGDVESAAAMADFSEEGLWSLAAIAVSQFKSSEMQSGSWHDYISSRRVFYIRLRQGAAIEGYVARRNRIRLDPVVGQNRIRVYGLKGTDAKSVAAVFKELYGDSQQIQIDADQASNAVLVQAPSSVQFIVGEVISRLDAAATNPDNIPPRNRIDEAPYNQSEYLKEMKRRISDGRDPLLRND